jgi:uroporphyrinogen decarboxylase
MFSPEIYRELVKPYHRRIMAAIKECSEAKIMYHSCGAILPLIEDLIDVGVDAINPIQVSAKDMEPATLKDSFGDRVAFWGGIDTQRLLPYGTADEVHDETDRIIDVLGRGGGYILASVHNIQAEVPPENIVAMFDAARAHPLGRA